MSFRGIQMRQLSFYMNALIEAHARSEIKWLFHNGQNIAVVEWNRTYLAFGETEALEAIKTLVESNNLEMRK